MYVCVYGEPECSLFLLVNFQVAPVNRNDAELIFNFDVILTVHRR